MRLCVGVIKPLIQIVESCIDISGKFVESLIDIGGEVVEAFID